MDQRRFDIDALARIVAGDVAPRRAAVRLLAGGAVATIQRRITPEGIAAADTRRRRKRCPRRRRCGKDCCRKAQVCLRRRCRNKGPCGNSSCFGKRCGSNDDFCLCTSSVEGIGFCLNGFAASCTAYRRCASSRQCRANELCLATADCCDGANLCVPRAKGCPSGTKRVRSWPKPPA